MAHTVINQFAVFTASSDLVEKLSDSLIPEIETIVILLAQCYDSNCFPQDPVWQILFIGTQSEFETGYLGEIGWLFDGRMLRGRSGVIRSSAHIGRLLMDQLSSAQPITASDCRQRGIEAFTWNADEAELLDIKQDSDCGVVPQPYQSPVRYGYKLASNQDAQRMVDQALQIVIKQRTSISEVEPDLLSRARPHPTKASNLLSRDEY